MIINVWMRIFENMVVQIKLWKDGNVWERKIQAIKTMKEIMAVQKRMRNYVS